MRDRLRKLYPDEHPKNPMLTKEHLESAHTETNDSLRKGLPTVKVLIANEPRLLVPYVVLLSLFSPRRFE